MQFTGKLRGAIEGHRNAIHRVVFHPSGKYIATSAWDGTSRLWHIAMRREVLRASIRIGSARRVTSIGASRYVTISPSGNKLAYIVSHEGRAAVLDLGTQQTTPMFRKGDLAQIAISPTGRWLVATPQHTTGVVIWDASFGNVAQELPTTGWANAAFSPNGKWLVTSD